MNTNQRKFEMSVDRGKRKKHKENVDIILD